MVNDPRGRILELRALLHRLNHQYYVLNDPGVSDFDFDALMRELEALEAAHPDMADPASPTQRVGSDLAAGFEQREHRWPMLSLGNVYSEEELLDFDRRVSQALGGGPVAYCCELKFDGLSISLTYRDGLLERAVTRGDGARGDDVTRNIKTIKSIPLRLLGGGYPPLFEVRGEVYMPRDGFDRLNADRAEAGERPFANPRNAASGSLKLQSPAEVARRPLDCFLYMCLADELPAASHYGNVQAAAAWGLRVSDAMRRVDGIQGALAYIREWEERRGALPFDTDGVVVKVDSLEQQRRLGLTAKSPRWAIAYKYKPQAARARLLSVDFQVGRTGVVTPVANLTPVALGGTTVRRATLHNAEFVAALDLHHGDTVLVEKGGEVIPKITGVVAAERQPGAERVGFARHCPECGAELARREGEAAWVCPNEAACPPQITGRLAHFTSRRAMDIESLGEETVQLLHRAGMLRDVADFYTLDVDAMAGLERLGEKSARNIARGVEASKQAPLERVIFGLGIRHVGETVARALARGLRSADALMQATEERLTQIPDVGPMIAASVARYFADPQNRALVERLRQHGLAMTCPEPEAPAQGGPLDGLKVLATGKMARYGRDEIKQAIERNGGRAVSSVSKATDLIVVGDNAGESKLEKARQLGIKMISEEEFEQMIAQP